MNDEAPAPDQLAPTTDDDVDSLHFAICQAVHLMNQGDLHAGHDLLRQTLIDFADKKAPLSRTKIIRHQQRNGAGEVSAIMVSPEPRICVLCGHAGKLNSNGVCVRLNAVKVEICGCICEFATASPAAPKEEDDLAQWSSVDNWPLPDVLNKLADATECLLHDYNYDRDGWEQLKYAALAARRHIALLATTPSPDAAREAAKEIVQRWLWHTPEHDQERARVGLQEIIQRHCFSAETKSNL